MVCVWGRLSYFLATISPKIKTDHDFGQKRLIKFNLKLKESFHFVRNIVNIILDKYVESPFKVRTLETGFLKTLHGSSSYFLSVLENPPKAAFK